ncbi:MAG: hypothetical protein HQM11_08945 [SAR324 cluster bacterium]|nr:hypothetical protein [SAR324 cluster bacterium]
MFKTEGMQLRELSHRIYQLLALGCTADGNSFHRIITVTENRHPQYTLDRIYRYLHKHHFYSPEAKTGQGFLIKRDNGFYLKSRKDLWEILKLVNIYPNFNEIPLHLRQQASFEMLENLVKAIPLTGVIDDPEQREFPYFNKTVRTEILKDQHPDGTKIPEYIEAIHIHRISWYGMRSIKIWEIIPVTIKNQSPVCLFHGYTSNYYSFHLQGLDSMDYHLAKNGNRLFILDHDRHDNNANLDVFAESHLTSTIDLAREQSGAPQVILMGHSMGGILSLIKATLECVHRPRFMNSIKAIITLNSPMLFEMENLLFLLSKTLNKASKRGILPFKQFFRIMESFPFFFRSMTLDIPKFLDTLQHRIGVNVPMLDKITDIHERLNPFTMNYEIASKGMPKALKNPPQGLHHHIAEMGSHKQGLTSYQGEWDAGWIDEGMEQEARKEVFRKNKYTRINYTENFFRLPPMMPMLVINSLHDKLSDAKQFDVAWDLWPQLHKIRLNHNPENERNTRWCTGQIEQFLQEHGLSSVIGVLVEKGRHMDTLVSEKETISAFLNAVEAVPVSLAEALRITHQAHVQFRNKTVDEESRFTAEVDFCHKIEAMKTNGLLEQEKSLIMDELLNLVGSYEPHATTGEGFYNFMVRGHQSSEHEDNVRYNILDVTVHKIMELQPDLVLLMENILNKARQDSQRLQQSGTNTTDTSLAGIPSECYRSLIDLSLALYDGHKTLAPANKKKFLKHFEEFLRLADAHPEKIVALHSFRAYFHTREPRYIAYGGELLINMRDDWSARAHQVFREEIEHQINEIKLADNTEFSKKMKSLMGVYQQVYS